MKQVMGVAAALLCGAVGMAEASAWTLEGRVYVDENGNGAADAGEPGAAGVPVSDGERVAVTDAGGAYRLQGPGAPDCVWVCVPRGHRTPGPFWRRAAGLSRADFGLVRHEQPDDFVFIQITDAHVGRADLVKAFAAQLGRYPMRCAFVVNTGDLVGGVDVVRPEKAQAQYDRYLDAAASFTVPLFHVPGNHEHVAINVPDADRGHPLYGKGLYRQTLGPTHYSWDWAGVHCVALDGTRVPYREMLGPEQLAWLAADLQAQPAEKPLILFCHQALFSLADAKELVNALKGRRVLAGFCGHLHKTFTSSLGGFPVYMSGALSGAWWSGPNIDGTPQGFRLVQVRGGQIQTVYGGREGACPVSIVSPVATAVRSGVMEVEASVIDFGRPVDVSASFEGHPVGLSRSSQAELWSVWRGSVDTRVAADGPRALTLEARQGGSVGASVVRYLVVNGKEEPFAAEAGATLTVQVRGVDVADAVCLNGEPLGEIPAQTANESTLTFEIAKERLRRMNRITVRAAPLGAGSDAFSFGPVALVYKGRRIHDLRYASFERFTVGGEGSKKAEKELFLCLP